MSIKSAIQHLHSMFDALEHPGAIPGDIKEYALKGIRSELQRLLDRVNGALPPEPEQEPLTTQAPAGPLPPADPDTGAVAGTVNDLMPDYLPPQTAAPVRGDNVDRSGSIELAAASNGDVAHN